MIDRETEYRKLFKLQRRWAKHWLTPSAHRAHSSTLSMREPANKTLQFINSIDGKGISFEEKTELLLKFYNEQNQKNFESFYFHCIQFIKSSMETIENGRSIVIPKIPRG